MNQIKEKMSKSSKRIAVSQISVYLCAIIIGVLLYQFIIEILKIPLSVLSDPDALPEVLEQIMNQFMDSILIAFAVGFIMFIFSVLYLVSFLQLTSSFARLSTIEPKVGQVAKTASNFLRISIILLILGIFLYFVNSIATTYITIFMYLASAAFMTSGYFFISKVFKILHELGLFPKKESRLIFYGQMVLMLSFVPLSFTLTNISITPIIIAGVIALGGLTCLSVGLFRLSKDALLIKEAPVSATSMIQVQTGFKEPTFTPSTIYTPPQSNETANDSEALSEPEVEFCFNCGAKLFTKTQFCKNCGVEL